MTQILFSLVPVFKNFQGRQLVSSQEERLRIVLSVAGEKIRRILYREYLLTFSKQKEELELLMKEELAARGISFWGSAAETTPFNEVHIPFQRVFHVLSLLASRSGLYFQNERLHFQSGAKDSLVLKVLQKADELFIRGELGGEDVTACSWIFPAPSAWFVRKGVLAPVKGAVDPFFWRLVFPYATALKDESKERFIERAETLAFVRWENKEGKRTAPSPSLLLKDPMGSCADLFFDYEEKGRVSFHDPLIAPWREREEERALQADLLEAGYLAKSVEDAHYFCPPSKVEEALKLLLEVGWRVQEREGREVFLETGSALSFSQEGELIAVGGACNFGEMKCEWTDLLEAYRRRERFLPLFDKGAGLIDRVQIEKRWGSLAGQEIVGNRLRIKRSHFGLLSSFPEAPKELCPKEAAYIPLDPGPLFQGRLHPYQRIGLGWLRFLWEAGFHGLLADEMGLGKTVQVMAFFSLLPSNKPHLLVMPSSLLFNWTRECASFLPSFVPYLHAGKERLTKRESFERERLVLTSYALLRQDLALLSSVEWGTLVLDEAQAIKNPDAQVSRAACALTADFRLALTGTPVENRHEDLWSLFHFLIPDLLGERKSLGGQVAQGEVKKKLQPFLLRRTKALVASELPEKIQQTVYVEMEEDQREFYQKFLQAQREGLLSKIARDGAAKHRLEILEVILRLRQICCHPKLMDPSWEGGCAKFDQLFEDMQQVAENSQKALIFSQFTQMLRLIEEEVRVRSFPYAYLDGGTKDRQGAVRRFQEDPGTLFFLCSLKAGGVGLNLQAADYVFLYDPWWNAAVENQAIDRAHRLGRKGVLHAKRYLTSSSIEERIDEQKAAKARIVQDLVEQHEELKELTTRDLINLLEDLPDLPSAHVPLP